MMSVKSSASIEEVVTARERAVAAEAAKNIPAAITSWEKTLARSNALLASFGQDTDPGRVMLKFVKQAEDRLSLLRKAQPPAPVAIKLAPQPPGSAPLPSPATEQTASAVNNPQPAIPAATSPFVAEFIAELDAAALNFAPTTFNDISGLDEAKQILQEALLAPALFPQLHAQNHLEPWSGVLLYGPPGTGKTMIAKAVACEAKMRFICIPFDRIMRRYQGESEELFRVLWEYARQKSPSIMFFDEIDAVCSVRSSGSSGESETSRRVLTNLLQQTEGLFKDPNRPVLLLGATNNPWDIDPAMRRRFERRVYIPLPERIDRSRIITKFLQESDLLLDPDQIDTILASTDGFSCHDISIAIKEVRQQPLRRLMKETHYFRNKDTQKLIPAAGSTVPPENHELVELTCWGGIKESDLDITNRQFHVTAADVMDVFAIAKPSVSQASLKQYEEFTRLYGRNGSTNATEDPLAPDVAVTVLVVPPEINES